MDNIALEQPQRQEINNGRPLGRMVVVVEDPHRREALIKLLRLRTEWVEEFASPQDAIQVVNAREIDGVITGIGSAPADNGLNLISKIRAKNPNAVCTIFSSKAPDIVRTYSEEERKKLGIDHLFDTELNTPEELVEMLLEEAQHKNSSHTAK